jgi:hypothetical protein
MSSFEAGYADTTELNKINECCEKLKKKKRIMSWRQKGSNASQLFSRGPTTGYAKQYLLPDPDQWAKWAKWASWPLCQDQKSKYICIMYQRVR